MLWVEIFCNYISRCSTSEVSFVNVNEMFSLIKKEVLNLAFVFRFFDLHLFQQDAVIMRNGSKFPNFLNKFRKPCGNI